ncbi:MAG TPA: hypothetical protein VGS19_23855 [Streptosporangiaceae bacterium]|nr:hypothetical protein [Streptosporangiaceae bacterium]
MTDQFAMPPYSPEPIHMWVTVTPEIATDWLNDRKTNRRLSQMWVDSAARDIAAGHHHRNHQGMAFSWLDGRWRMHDGQHRCAAVVKTGIPIRISVWFGTDPDGVDVGRTRQYGHQLAIDERFASASTVAASARLISIWTSSAYPPGTGTNLKPTWDEMDALLAAHPCIADTIHLADRTRKGCGMRASVAAWFRYVTAHLGADCKSSDDDWFITRLAEGDGLKTGHPALTLRNRVISDRHFAHDPFRLAAGCIYAWNAYREGRDLVILKIPANLTPANFPEAK